MPHRMYVAKTEVMFLAELVKPKVRRIVVHWLAIPFDKQAIIVDPLAAQFFTFLVLLRLV